MTGIPSRKFLSLTVACIMIMVLFAIFKRPLASLGFDINFLLMANLLLYFLSYLSFIIQIRGIGSKSSFAYVRGLYLSVLLKMAVIIGGLFIYIYLFNGKVTMPALFTAMGIYLIYTSIEVIQLMKIARKKPDA